jgi:tetratricopeptide (TPR) repeat protein
MEVFISYARASSRQYAEALFREIGSETAFLDTEDIEYSDQFPQRLIDALFTSRVIVIFADQLYFSRWYCLLEWRAALAPYTYTAEQASSAERLESLESIVVGLPPVGVSPLDAHHLPPELQHVNWPKANDTAAIAAQVRRKLAMALPSLAERIDAGMGTERFHREWLEVARLPRPIPIPPQIPFVHPRGLRRTLNEGLVGRLKDLWRIHNAMNMRPADSQQSGVIVALEGGAGVGKSTLAREYLYRFGPRHYQGGLFWIDAERPLPRQYHELTRALNPHIPDWEIARGDPAGVVDRLISELRALTVDEPALVVLDNIPEPRPGKSPKSLDDWFPAAEFVRLLITSRSRFSLSDSTVASLQIDELDESSAPALLTRGIDFRALEESDWRAISDWVGRLPLALELLNRALAHQAFTPDELLLRANSAGTTAVLDQAMEALRPVLPAGSLRGASEALTFSYERLPNQAKAAARLIAWLAPYPIPMALYDAISGSQPDLSVRSVLVNRSFVMGGVARRVPIFGSMHSVVADFLQTQSEDTFGELTLLTRAILSVMQPIRLQSPDAWPLMEACEPHAVTLLNHVVTKQPRIDFVPHTAMLACALVTWYLEQGLSELASNLAIQTLPEISVEVEPGELVIPAEIPEVLKFISVLPQALAQNEEYDSAIALQRINLEWLEQKHGSSDKAVLAQGDNLALMLRNRGQENDLDEAYQILKGNLAAWRVHDPVSLDTLTALNNLALVEDRLGDHTEAAAHFEEVLESLQQLENVEMQVIITKQSLADNLMRTNPERAMLLLRDALRTADRIEIPDRHWVKLHLLQSLGVRAHSDGDYAQAQLFLKRVIQVLQNELGDRDATTTSYAWVLFDSERRSGDIDGSKETCQRYLSWLLGNVEVELTPQQLRIQADLLSSVDADA